MSNDRARYIAVAEHWTDVPEAEPRCRIRVPEGADTCLVTVDEDGALIYEVPARGALMVDMYDSPPPDREHDAPGTQAERYASIRERRAPEM